MPPLTLFLDEGGVLNDDTLRGAQWPPLVGEFFAPRLGGAPEAWAQANRVVMQRLLEPPAWSALLSTAANHAGFERLYYSAWLQGMCDLVGVPRPSEQECLALGAAAEAAIVPRLRAAFPGAVDTVRALHASGYTLHMASGGASRMLDLGLTAMGIRHCFGRLYGPDLVDTFKHGPAFYERILADLALPPHQALFVDDSPKALAWADQTGARTLLVGQRADAANFQQIGSLAELPQFLRIRTAFDGR
jgi:HAD superfamily hydrolase (TIGR01509 family)